MGHRRGQLALQRRLDAAVDRQRNRLAALERIAEPGVEHPLHSGDAVAVHVGPAEDVGGERGLRIEPLGLAAELDGGSPSAFTASTSSGIARRARKAKLFPDFSTRR